MPPVPAVCKKCGTMFSSGIAMGAGAGAHISDVGAGPCPNCGSMGFVPDGFYQATSDTQLLRRSSRSSLHDLRSTLVEVRQGRLDVVTAAERLQATSDEASRAIGRKLLANQENQVEFLTWLSLLIAIIALLTSLRSEPAQAPQSGARRNQSIEQPVDVSDAQIEAIIEKSIEACLGRSVVPSQASSQVPPTSTNPARSGRKISAAQRKIGRNEQCPCGSGKKYKRCCGG